MTSKQNVTELYGDFGATAMNRAFIASAYMALADPGGGFMGCNPPLNLKKRIDC